MLWGSHCNGFTKASYRFPKEITMKKLTLINI
jgi:hypothetical protein